MYNPEPSANWVTDTAVNEIFVEGDCGFTPSGKQAYACTWSGDVWVPILTGPLLRLTIPRTSLLPTIRHSTPLCLWR